MKSTGEKRWNRGSARIFANSPRASWYQGSSRALRCLRAAARSSSYCFFSSFSTQNFWSAARFFSRSHPSGGTRSKFAAAGASSSRAAFAFTRPRVSFPQGLAGSASTRDWATFVARSWRPLSTRNWNRSFEAASEARASRVRRSATASFSAGVFAASHSASSGGSPFFGGVFVSSATGGAAGAGGGAGAGGEDDGLLRARGGRPGFGGGLAARGPCRGGLARRPGRGLRGDLQVSPAPAAGELRARGELAHVEGRPAARAVDGLHGLAPPAPLWRRGARAGTPIGPASLL